MLRFLTRIFKFFNPDDPVVIYPECAFVKYTLTSTDSPMFPMYENIRIEDHLSFNIFTYMTKKEPYPFTRATTAVSGAADLVISRNNTSIRVGEYSDLGVCGRLCICEGPEPIFDQAIEDGLGMYRGLDQPPWIQIYTSEDIPSDESHGVMIMASNFLPPGTTTVRPNYPDREGYLMIEPEADGSIRNIEVKGSLDIDYHIELSKENLPECKGWFFNPEGDKWYQPPADVPFTDTMCVAGPGDLVISKGRASVLVSPNKKIQSVGPVAVLLVPVINDPVCGWLKKTVVVFTE